MIDLLKRLRPRTTASDVEARDNTPFFILGCVRSGTTMLRDILRMHPRLECPEETHFFRWPDPFASPRFMHPYRKNQVIRKQQRMDGISEAEFEEIISRSASRKDLAENYGRLYLEKQGNPEGRWFDKTPQNIYGILLLSHMFPESRFVHIHRNPLNVVASLYKSKVLSITNMAGATSYWYESMAIMDQYKKLAGERVLEVAYERVTSEPESALKEILEFLDEDPALLELPSRYVHPERNSYRKVLDAAEIEEVKARCAPFYEQYGYR